MRMTRGRLALVALFVFGVAFVANLAAFKVTKDQTVGYLKEKLGL